MIVARADRVRRRAVHIEALTALEPAFEGFTLFPDLKSVRAPTLVIHGDLDFFPVESSAHIAQAIPGARLEILRDSGHFSYIDASERVHRALEGFL